VAPRRLVETLDLLRNFLPFQDAERFTSWNATPRAMPVMSSAADNVNNGASSSRYAS